ncbi:MAG: Rieske (2Fe-2S) protein [Candidatus Hydrogenedentes bacterium]|nr:Rieske (2Fe-2S) protein [Candidatus Hydrogenedentota bacterium]
MAVASTIARIRVGTVQELAQDKVRIVHGADVPIAVFAADGRFYAVDNRCPHMGFPLQRGTVKDGLLTCHWHEARFDLASGCTFDLWADDVPAYDVTVDDGVVYVSPVPRVRADASYYRMRLLRGMEQDIGLIQAKALLGLLSADGDVKEVIRAVADFALRNLEIWSEGMVRLTCVTNLFPVLSAETRYYAMFYAVRRIADEASESVPRRERHPLDTEAHDFETLKRWLRQWVITRHRDGAERTILTAVERGFPKTLLADLVFGVAAERPYADRGHVFDFHNKIFELNETLGNEYVAPFLAMGVPALVRSRGGEESTEWHHPIEIIEPLRALERELPNLLKTGHNSSWRDDGQLADILLGDEPVTVLRALQDALEAGAPPTELAKRVAYAAALRLAQFSLANEVGDWFNPRHTFIYANAVHQAVRRSPTPDVVRAIRHAAIAVYLDRYLNVPPARLPEDDDLDDLPREPRALREGLLDCLNRWGQVDLAARYVARYLRLGLPAPELFDTLAYATLREDLDFHTFQVLEAGVRQFSEWHGRPEAEHILIGVVRSLAALCPTPRAQLQTANIALRLHRGEELYTE